MQYSTNAMPQATKMTPINGVSLNAGWPYQASVMKMLEPSSSRMGST